MKGCHTCRCCGRAASHRLRTLDGVTDSFCCRCWVEEGHPPDVHHLDCLIAQQEQDGLAQLTQGCSLSAERLEAYAKSHPPPQSWYDEDFSGLFGEKNVEGCQMVRDITLGRFHIRIWEWRGKYKELADGIPVDVPAGWNRSTQSVFVDGNGLPEDDVLVVFVEEEVFRKVKAAE